MNATDHDHASLRDELGTKAQNVLVLSSPMEDRSDAACAELLSAEPDADRDVLFVTLARSPDDQLRRWQSHGDARTPANLAFVAAGESTRSAAESSVADGGPPPRVQTVSSPGDLTGLGIEISKRLEAWADDGNRTVMCFHTLTTLFQYVDLEQAFQFIHVLSSRVRIADARAHYHADPSAHDDRELNTMRTLFDAVVEPSGDGWTVRTR